MVDRNDYDRDYRYGRNSEGDYERTRSRQGYGRDSADWDYERYRGRPGYSGRGYTPYGYTAWDYEWTTIGPYVGRGPRGYQRSDARILDDICERLTQHGDLDASEIEVEVKDCEVTLRGEVDSRWAKREAEYVAESVFGVKDVHNQLKVESNQWAGSLTGRSRVRAGMEVVGNDGNLIGKVKEVYNGDFLVDRPLARDVYVPFNACQYITNDRVVLNIRAQEVEAQNWPVPELVGKGR